MSEIKPVVRFGARRLSPEGTTEMWGDILNNAELKQGDLLYPAAAYEALKVENDTKADRIAELEKEVKSLRKQKFGLLGARKELTSRLSGDRHDSSPNK